MTDETPMRRCSKCGREKPKTAEYFCLTVDSCLQCYANRECRDAEHYCPLCDKSFIYYGSVNKSGKDLFIDFCGECSKVIKKKKALRRYKVQAEEYRKNNAEKIRAWRSQYYARNRDKIREYQRSWAKNNPLAIKAKSSKRRSLIANAPGSYTAEDIQIQIKSQTNRKGQLCCWWCGNPIKGKYHVDHRIPLARGGSNSPDNIVIAHAKCNLSKGAKLPAELGRLF